MAIIYNSNILSIPKTSALGSLLAFVVRANINLYRITTGITKFVIILCLIPFNNLKFLYGFWLLTKFRIQFDIVSQDSGISRCQQLCEFLDKRYVKLAIF